MIRHIVLGHKDPRKGNTMNEEILTPAAAADTPAAAPLTDAQLAALLANPGTDAFVTTDEDSEGEAESPTIH